MVARVRAAQPEWEAIGIAGRRRWLESLRDWILDHQDELDDRMQEETGKVRADAALEAFYLLDADQLLVRPRPALPRRRDRTPHVPLLRHRRAKISYHPYPVAGIISPWNFPLILSLGDGIPALVAGCALVIKPSEFTPLTLMELVRAWKEELGAPDVLDVVNGMGETGGALVDECDFIQFTGSERTGKVVMKRAADTLTPVSLELGGKDPMIVTTRRGPRPRGQRRRLRRPAEHRPDLHLDRARVRGGAGLRRVRRQAPAKRRSPAPGSRRSNLLGARSAR